MQRIRQPFFRAVATTAATVPAYSIENYPMRPVTKISLLGIRLAIIALAIYWIAIFTGTHLPAVSDFSPRMNDKIKHFSAFFGLATLLCYSTTSSNLVKRFGTIAAVIAVYAAFDEFTQQFIPGRTADPYDFIADMAGALTAIAVYIVVRWMLASKRTPAV